MSFNYRLRPLDYLDFSGYGTPSHPIESNLGLRDKVAALAWVQHNIHRLGATRTTSRCSGNRLAATR